MLEGLWNKVASLLISPCEPHSPLKRHLITMGVWYSCLLRYKVCRDSKSKVLRRTHPYAVLGRERQNEQWKVRSKMRLKNWGQRCTRCRNLAINHRKPATTEVDWSMTSLISVSFCGELSLSYWFMIRIPHRCRTTLPTFPFPKGLKSTEWKGLASSRCARGGIF